MRTTVSIVYLSLILLVLTTGCDPQSPASVDPMLTSPAVRSLTLATTTVNTDTILVGNERLPDDILPIRIPASVGLARWNGLTEVRAEVRDRSGSRISSTAQFQDTGAYPDGLAGDSVYSGVLSFSVERSVTGMYTVSVWATDQSELASNSLVASLTLVRANQPPVISSLGADTLVSLSDENRLLKLQLAVADPDGLADVHRVWFNSFRPDSVASSGNPFLMFDDGMVNGISGDETAGDGIYSLTIELPPTAMLGTYRFSFQAVDRSRDSSNVIDHFLTVVP